MLSLPSPVMVIFQGRGGVPVARLGPLLHRTGDSVPWHALAQGVPGEVFPEMDDPLPSNKLT